MRRACVSIRFWLGRVLLAVAILLMFTATLWWVRGYWVAGNVDHLYAAAGAAILLVLGLLVLARVSQAAVSVGTDKPTTACH